jgi:uncharacterized membrane protein YcaP (DUF421 family)
MGTFFDVDWKALFGLSIPLLEILLRGSLIYLALVVMFRLLLKREAGSMGLTDLLVIVLVASAAESGISGGYHSITDGVILIGTVLAWDYLLDRLSFRFPAVRRLLNPPEVKLVDRGRVLYRSLRREFVTEEELLSEVRKKGLESFDQVKAAYMESDGRISVIPARGSRILPGSDRRTPHE